MSFCRAFGLVLAIAVLGCRSGGIKVSPDAGASVLTDAAAKDAQTFFADVAPVEALSGKDESAGEDAMSLADSASDVSPDVRPAFDSIAVVDSARESSPAGSDTPAIPRDVTVHTARDFSDADPQCVAATPGWLSLIATFLAQAQQCSADSDCTYVSFSDGCGEICALPMNWQRIGELGTPIYGYASSNCTTCPKLPSYPACAPPTTMFCNAGRCEYER
jgi:hypothetical protein